MHLFKLHLHVVLQVNTHKEIVQAKKVRPEGMDSFLRLPVGMQQRFNVILNKKIVLHLLSNYFILKNHIF